MSKKKIVIIGGGAAGLYAAVKTAEYGGDAVDVTVIEPNDRMGKKLRITGKGRCNLTNDCDRETFLANVPTNPRFLYAAIAALTPRDVMADFEGMGVPLKVERGQRVFPVSDRAHDVADALVRTAHRSGVHFVGGKVDRLLTTTDPLTGETTLSGVACGGRTFVADAAILCTGGCSYPVTGSDGSGYRLAASVGHTIQPAIPSLVPLVCADKVCPAMMGLSLRNVRLSVVLASNHKTVFEDFGEMLFTHYGVTGPLVLSASAHMHDLAVSGAGKYELHIDFKPALDEATLDARLLSDFKKYANKDFINALGDLLPLKAIQPMVEASGIDPRKKVNAITREERRALCRAIKCLTLHPTGFRPLSEAIVTKGGVTTSEVNPKTMGSKLCGGLYFAGEVLDVDAYTGGFNLQIAFSTAHLAATAVTSTR